MKHLMLTAIVCSMLLSCDAAPQRSQRRDTTRIEESPAAKRLMKDSPARTGMPVIRADTAQQADMPIAVPPKNIQPK
jgi:starvation-inducible outer membrane lipoprotein